MGTFKHNLRIQQGATFNEVHTWRAGSPLTPVDLTGCTARAQIRSSVSSAAVLFEFTTENGRITLGGVNGTVAFDFSDAATSALTWRNGIYQLEVEFPSGFVRRLMAGTAKVSPESTK